MSGEIVNQEWQENDVSKTVDLATRARAGMLAANGFLEQAIADTLLLSLEQVLAIKQSPEFRNKYAEIAEEQINRQIDLADGWDLLEEKAVKALLETLEYNRDPRYVLNAARVSNEAKRRRPSSEPRVIDASKKTNNVIVLQMNKNYVTKIMTASESKSAGMIDVSPRVTPEQQRITDLPSPKAVEELLAPVRKINSGKVLTELEQAFKIAGVFQDDEPA